jgi:hypothetical protein
MEPWHESLGGWKCIGYQYSSPATDGERVYIVTYAGGMFCYDLDGKLVWAHTSEYETRRAGYGVTSRELLIHKDMVLTDHGAVYRAYDRATGKLRWSNALFSVGQKASAKPLEKGHSTTAPCIIKVGGEEFFLGCNAAVRLRDGKLFPVTGWCHGETYAKCVDRDRPDTVFFAGSGEHSEWKGMKCHLPPAALKYTLDGDTLKTELLWQGINGEWGGGQPGCMVYHNNRLYIRATFEANCSAILDAQTGKVIAGGNAKGRADNTNAATPSTAHLLQMAGKRLYGFNSARVDGAPGLVEVYDLEGKKLAANTIERPVVTPEQVLINKLYVGWSDARGNSISYGHGFTFDGERIYLRTMMRLICYGPRK